MSNSSPSEFRRLPISQQDIDLNKEPREINELVNELKLNFGD
ncbi:13990_t:CDS:1, partial [Cetraspora pellucida]